MTMTLRVEGEYPFEVKAHRLMAVMLPGKVPGTVLTIERQIYTARICQYIDPTGHDRHWCYHSVVEAEIALAHYLSNDKDSEPLGWVRAFSVDEGIRRQRGEDAGPAP